MKAVVLCAGFGTRLGSLTEERPKPLLDVGDRTIVEHILGQLSQHGVEDVWINVHHHAPQFPAKLGDGSRYGVKLSIVHEDTPVGTAGTPRDLRERLCGDAVLVHYGDILTNHDLGGLMETHRRTGAEATIVVHRRPHSNSYVFVDEQDRVTRFVERPSKPPAVGPEGCWVFSGICVLSEGLLARIPPAPNVDLPRDVFPQLALSGGLVAHRLNGYRCAIDSPERLQSARDALAQGTFVPASRRLS